MEYTEASEVVKDKFLLVSYNHKDDYEVSRLVKELGEKGVRLWCDKPLKYGQRWFEVVKGLLTHENCCGAILFFSVDSILSVNVAKEWKEVIDQQEKRGEENYAIYPVNVCKQGKPVTYMQLLKGVFDAFTYDELPKSPVADNIKTFMKIIEGDPIAAMTGNEDCLEKFLSSINETTPQVFDEHFSAMQNIERQTSRDGVFFVNFGYCNISGKNKSLKWRFIARKQDTAVFLCEDVVSLDFGGEHLTNWLNNEFTEQTFDADEKAFIQNGIRLLRKEEADDISSDVLSADEIWWLEDCRGNLQQTILENGTLYDYGYNNKRFRYGVRPVIELSLKDVSRLGNK